MSFQKFPIYHHELVLENNLQVMQSYLSGLIDTEESRKYDQKRGIPILGRRQQHAQEQPNCFRIPVVQSVPTTNAHPTRKIIEVPFYKNGSYNSNWHNSGKHNFLKRFSRKNEYSMNVSQSLPDLSSDEEISIRVLQIGPEFHVPSEYTEIINKIKAIEFDLQQLSEIRQKISVSVLALKLNELDLIISKPPRNHLDSFLAFIINACKNEYFLLEMVFYKLDSICLTQNMRNECTNDLLADLKESITNLMATLNLAIVRLPPGEAINNFEEVDILKSTIDDLVLSIRYAGMYIWSLEEILTFKMKAAPSNPMKWRDIFIGG